MRIGVIGGTGRIGARVCVGALGRGHDVVSFTRSGSAPEVEPLQQGIEAWPGDITKKSDLQRLADECDVIYDLTDSRTAADRLAEGARNLVEAARQSPRSPRLVCLGILNADGSAYEYYRAKTAQAEIYRGYEESSVLSASQFFSFLNMIFDGGRRLGCILWPTGTSFQPVSEADVADELLRVLDGPVPEDWRLAGPETITAREAAKRYRMANSSRRILVPFRIPGVLGAFFRAGKNIDESAPKASARYSGATD